jgi:hypothetical protein
VAEPAPSFDDRLVINLCLGTLGGFGFGALLALITGQVASGLYAGTSAGVVLATGITYLQSREHKD